MKIKYRVLRPINDITGNAHFVSGDYIELAAIEAQALLKKGIIKAIEEKEGKAEEVVTEPTPPPTPAKPKPKAKATSKSKVEGDK